MKFTVLGCDGSYPDALGATSGYLVSGAAGKLQLDLGCGVLPRLMAQAKPEELAALYITHWHSDHASDLLTLKYYLLIRQKQLRVYAPAETHPIRDLLEGPEFLFLDIAQAHAQGDFKVSSLKVSHPLPAHALRIEEEGRTLVYTGDAVGGEGLAEFCSGADLLICDATFTTAQWHSGLPHFSAAQAGQLAKEARVQQLMLTHAQPGSDKQQLLKEASLEFPASLMASPGLTLLV